MNDRERFHACLNYQPVDVVPHWTWGGWPETIQRWITEGYDPQTMDLTMGANRVFWVSTWFFPNPPFEHQVIEEDEKTNLYINHEGILMRERKDQPYSSMPQFVRFPVETREEFRAFWKKRMQPDLVRRVGEDWKERLQKLHDEPIPLVIISDRWGGFFGPLRNLVGVERLCTLFYDDPAFVEEMMDANADFLIAMLEQILDAAPIDAFAFWEDMAYRSGPLLSPKLARRYMLPRYRRVVEFLRKRGVPFIGLDSDGDVTTLIPIWMDAGLNFLYPFEVQAGMDVLAVRRQFGKELRLIGGIAKQAVAAGPEAIERELARVKPLIDEGGYIPMLDHSCPPDISFANYAYYMRRLGEVCQQTAQ